MADDLTPEEFADGMALWEEHKPQSAEDWIAVAQRFLADDGDRSKSSPLFAALVATVEMANTNEMRATMAEEAAGDLLGRLHRLPAEMRDRVLGPVGQRSPEGGRNDDA